MGVNFQNCPLLMLRVIYLNERPFKNEKQKMYKQGRIKISIKQKTINGISLIVSKLKSRIIIGGNSPYILKARSNMDSKFIQFEYEEKYVEEDFKETKL